jgi:hypothetical protein
VDRGAPFHSTVDPTRNPDPLTVRMNSEPPAVAEFGLKLAITGVGGLMVNEAGAEVTPPGASTVTLTVAWEAIRFAGTDAVHWFELTKPVDRGDPFHCTTDPGRNPEPLTVKVKEGPPAVADRGLRLEMDGEGAPIVKVTEVEADPPGLVTMTLALPWEAIRLAGIATFNRFALT